LAFLYLIHGIEEGLCPALGNGPDVLHHLVVGHADPVVLNCDGPFFAVWDDPDLEFGIFAEDAGFGLRLEPDLVDGVRCIRDELP